MLRDRMKVYGYPRSGNNYFLELLWRNFGDGHGNRLSAWGSHFASSDGSLGQGLVPRTVVDDSILLVRRPAAVLRSVWAMREWYGLIRAKSFDELLGKSYADSHSRSGWPAKLMVNTPTFRGARLGLDGGFAYVDRKPLEHYLEYNGEMASRCALVVRYEDAVSDPAGVLELVSCRFGGQQRKHQLVLCDERVGYNVQEARRPGE